MNKAKVFTIVGLLVFCIVVFLPPIIHGYVYPNVGDDTAVHLQVFERIRADEGDPNSSFYILSYVMVGYPIVWISNLTSVSLDTLFLWFSYWALALIGVVIYFVMSRLVSKWAGWLALVLTLFCAQGILFQFYYGQIFNAINMGLILPLLLYFTVRYLTQGRVYQLVIALALSGLFGTFHTSGIYLPFVTGFAMIVYVLYSMLGKHKIKARFVILSASIIVLSAIAFLLFVPMGGRFMTSILDISSHSKMAVPLASYMMGIVSPTILVLLTFIGVCFKDVVRNISVEAKIIAFVLLCMASALSVAAFANISPDPFRQALDLATVLALLVAVLVSVTIRLPKNQVVVGVLLLVVGFGLWHNLPPWFDYNSAVRPVDEEAIAYVNSLGYENYNFSPEVAPWIYDRFLTSAKGVRALGEGAFLAPLLIARDVPMTPRSDPKNIWYEGHGLEPDDDYILLATFSDGEVTVKVYENTGKGVIVPID